MHTEELFLPEMKFIHSFLHSSKELSHSSLLVLRLLAVGLEVAHVVVQPAHDPRPRLLRDVPEEVHDGGAHLPDRRGPVELWKRSVAEEGGGGEEEVERRRWRGGGGEEEVGMRRMRRRWWI